MRTAALCKGIGGLDLAVEAHFGAEAVWYSEIDPAPSTVLERHWPLIPNLGDLKAIDWHAVPPVDVLTAGYPCQPFSHAGKRKGTDDPRHLWPYIAEAVRVLRPRWVVLENVAGHLSLGFGDVLRDLAEAGFDAEWCLLRASDVGACHQRARLFIVATDASGGGRIWGTPGDEPALGWRDGVPAERGQGERQPAGVPGPAAHPESERRPSGRRPGAVEGLEVPQRPAVESGGCGDALPTNTDGHGHGSGQDDGGVGRLGGPDAGASRQRERSRQEPGDRSAATVDWGDYGHAIRRHELAFGRPAPSPTDDRGRLNVPFVEWMMGYPEGWVDGLTRTQALKALGNAVVPRQALAALRELCPIDREVAA